VENGGVRDAFRGSLSKKDVSAAIRDVESHTSAELVVALRPSSGRYRETALAAGGAFALVVLSLLLFLPVDFETLLFPVYVALAFVLMAACVELVPPLRRMLIPSSTARGQVRVAARAAFVDLDVSHTQRRGGILVYVSELERMVEVVVDSGIDVHAEGARFTGTIAEAERALGAGDAPRFLAALRAIGPILAVHHPRAADDVNELSDEVA
jgi:putative membrane protein